MSEILVGEHFLKLTYNENLLKIQLEIKNIYMVLGIGHNFFIVHNLQTLKFVIKFC